MSAVPEAVRASFTPESTAERMLPSLTAAQIARLALHGQRRPIRSGETLFEVGAPTTPFFVITEGLVEIVRPTSRALIW